MKISPSKLAISLSFPLIVGLSSGFMTIEGIQQWYVFLKTPPLTPPSWVFGPVWTILYLSMGLSLYLFWNTKKPVDTKGKGYFFFMLQLITNFLWSLFFFGLRSPMVALLNIFTLLVLIILNIYFFHRINKTSGLILIPYLLWVSFATYLNIGFFLLN